MKKLNWAASQRQSYISERLRNVGTLNRFDLEGEFGISSAQASIDIAYFIKENPGLTRYDVKLKQYVLCEKNDTNIEDLIESLYWEFDHENKLGNLSERDVFKKKMRRIVAEAVNQKTKEG